MLKHRPPKPYKLFKFCVSFVTTVKFRNSATLCKTLRYKHVYFPIFEGITEIIKKIQEFVWFWGTREVWVWLKVHNLVSVYPKDMKLSEIINLNKIFHVVLSDYRLVTIWNLPQFPVVFRNCLFGGLHVHVVLNNLSVWLLVNNILILNS